MTFTLGDAANVAEVVGAVTVVGAAAFGVLQLRQYARLRRDSAATQILHAYQDETWARCVRRVWRLADHADPRDIAADDGAEEAAVYVGIALNGMGFIVHEETVPLAFFARWDRTTPMVCWRKLDRWVDAVRRRSGVPTTYAWFEWLAAELVKVPVGSATGAEDRNA